VRVWQAGIVVTDVSTVELQHGSWLRRFRVIIRKKISNDMFRKFHLYGVFEVLIKNLKYHCVVWMRLIS